MKPISKYISVRQCQSNLFFRSGVNSASADHCYPNSTYYFKRSNCNHHRIGRNGPLKLIIRKTKMYCRPNGIWKIIMSIKMQIAEELTQIRAILIIVDIYKICVFQHRKSRTHDSMLLLKVFRMPHFITFCLFPTSAYEMINLSKSDTHHVG